MIKDAKKGIDAAQKILGTDEVAAAVDSLKNLQSDLKDWFDEQSENKQEKLGDEHQWLQDFMDQDLDGLSDYLEQFLSLEVM
jgi:hypothetical protein